MSAIIDLHHTIMFYIFLVAVFVLYIIIFIVFTFEDVKTFHPKLLFHWYYNHLKHVELERA